MSHPAPPCQPRAGRPTAVLLPTESPGSGHTGLAVVKALQTLAAAALPPPGATAPNCPAPPFASPNSASPSPGPSHHGQSQLATVCICLLKDRPAGHPPSCLPLQTHWVCSQSPARWQNMCPHLTVSAACPLRMRGPGSQQPAASTTSSSGALALSRETQAPPAAPRAVRALREPFLSFLTRGCTRGFMYSGGGGGWTEVPSSPGWTEMGPS